MEGVKERLLSRNRGEKRKGKEEGSPFRKISIKIKKNLRKRGLLSSKEMREGTIE